MHDSPPDAASAPTPHHTPVATIVQGPGEDPDAVLIRFVDRLRRSGRRVRGLVQTPRPPGQGKQMVLIDLDDESVRYDIAQPLGPDARGCRVDPTAVAAVSAVLRRARAEGADLVVANRFGTLEAVGGGLASEMLALMLDSTPLLTVTGPTYLEAWRAFTGGIGTELPPRVEALQAWFDGLPERDSPDPGA